MYKLSIMSVVGVILIASLGVVLEPRPSVPASRPEALAKPETIFAVGRVEGASTEIELRPEIPGRVAARLVHEGQIVEAGQVLLRLEDSQYRQEVALARAELAVARAKLQRLSNGAHPQQLAEAAALHQAKLSELERVKLQWERIRGLLASKSITRQEADDQRTRVASLLKEAEAAGARLKLIEAPAREDDVRIDQANIQVAEARLELAQVQLQRTELRAPRRAQVLKAEIEAGEMTGPASLEPAVVLADTSCFRIRAFVEELDAPRVRLGMPATITIEGMPGEPIRGRVGRLSPRMTRKELSNDRPNERFDTKMREVWIELDGASEGCRAPGPERALGSDPLPASDRPALVLGLRVDVLIEIPPAGGGHLTPEKP